MLLRLFDPWPSSIWIVMSRVVIPLVSQKDPVPITVRWWIQLVGHIAFVGMPMMWALRRR
jgi:hypothetical protein